MGCDFHMCSLTFTPTDFNNCMDIVIQTVINTKEVNEELVQVLFQKANLQSVHDIFYGLYIPTEIKGKCSN
jgi:hypothetical protein